MMNSGFEHEAINISIIYDGEEFNVSVKPGEYRSLMALIADNIDVESFGECGGTGRCSTCKAEIVSSIDHIIKPKEDEQNTLSKWGITSSNIRLTCQIDVDYNLNNLKLILLS